MSKIFSIYSTFIHFDYIIFKQEAERFETVAAL